MSRPPIRHVQTWAAEYRGSRPVLDVSQGTSGASPPDVPVSGSRTWVSYGEREGTDGLREAMAADVRAMYRTPHVATNNILMTAGCNEAFCAAIGALVGAGDEVVLFSPFYFNHDMWLRLIGASPKYIPFPFNGEIDEKQLEDVARSARAIVATSPSNPTGAEFSRRSLNAIRRVCREYGIPFVLDETYSVFRREDRTTPHEMFLDDWEGYFVSLRSLSKEFSMPGHRVGALIAGAEVLEAASKWHDCMAIAAPTPGQAFAEFALRELQAWRGALAQRVRLRGQHFARVLEAQESHFILDSAGGFFLWLTHPFTGESDESAARLLAVRLGVLTVPGSFFAPGETGRLRLSAAAMTPARAQDLLIRLEETRSW